MLLFRSVYDSSAIFLFFTQTDFCRRTMAFARLRVGIRRIVFSSSTPSSTSALDCSPRILMIHGLPIPSSF